MYMHTVFRIGRPRHLFMHRKQYQSQRGNLNIQVGAFFYILLIITFNFYCRIPSKVAFLFMIATSWFCLITASQYEDVEMLAPPERPSSISNIEELRRYIKELNMYYLILARPRLV